MSAAVSERGARDALSERAAAAFHRGHLHRARDLADVGLNDRCAPAEEGALLRVRARAELALGHADEARLAASRALALDPADAAEAHGLLATAAAALGHHGDAAAGYRRAAALDPGQAGWPAGLATALLELGDHLGAADAAKAALRLDAGDVDARLVLGRRALRDGDPAAAVEWLRPAAARADLGAGPRADLHATLGVALAATGDLQNGLREYEWRQRLPGWNPRPFDIPPWTGGPLDGKRLLLWSEQGLGDSVQFARFAAGARARGAQVIFHGEPRLVRLFRSCAGFDQVLSLHAPRPAADLHASLVSLPALLDTSPEIGTASSGYLHAEPEREAHWRRRLAAGPRPRVGLAWQGNPTFCDDDRRSLPLAYMTPLVQTFASRIDFVSLQKGFGQDQLHLLPPDAPIDDLGADLDNDGDAFVDSAALLSAVDLLITSDTALAHLAGALARPVWTMLSRVPDWRWGIAGTTTPWYPTMRLFRQVDAGAWPQVIDDVTAALRAWLDATILTR